LANPSPTKSVNERCWTLVGRRQGPFWVARRRRPTRGGPASVEFDAAWVLKREEDRGDVVGFYHTHPAALPEPSARDVRTMRAWTSSLGKPLLCLIESDGRPAAFRFDHDRSDGVNLAACELLPQGMVVVYDKDRETYEDGQNVPA